MTASGDEATTDELSMWRDGTARNAIETFFHRAESIPPGDRVAVFDNDGTLWCERPSYAQHEFINWGVADRLSRDPNYEPPALLAELDGASIGHHSPQEVAAAANDAFAGLTPEEFRDVAQRFAASWRHGQMDRSLHELRYGPMVQLLNALRRRAFDVFIVTGSGTDFVRSISQDLYGVNPECVVGSLVTYRYEADGARLVRGVELLGPPNEGPEKVSRIQTMLGRRPIFAAGNSAGDTEMLQYAQSGEGPSLALLVDHDDGDREYSYASVAASFGNDTPIVDVAHANGWTVTSMRNDWTHVFDPDSPA